ncbi:hypothetical protein CVT24_008726 [Panaeolus cyanescens]|uniref:F-box domain-containing protein n=1 Tax=Panaeolus cyanescens TaxID=181874 RepID=A0A409VDM8_9AGAR|nr:hypothetical protein CVT24_008726 [Panaeolus cyanescens]
MLNRPTEFTQTDAQSPTHSKAYNKNKSQHGIHDIRCPILLDVPPETLTEITTYLEPPELCALAVVNRYLNNHVKDDNTWRRAFVYQFLGIKPENDLDKQNTLLLRRSERTWRMEFIVHYKLRRRWAKSRNVTTTHTPVHSVISGMHMMSTPPQSLLTSSIQYGIIGRSFPMTGRVLPGFLDASGTRLGLGVGNPNTEFTPNVSICAISSDGGTAKIIWGTLLGDVLFMTAPRAIEVNRRSAVEVRRCNLADQHMGAVVDAQWIHAQNGYAVTGGMDGRVKVWDTKTAVCLWTSIQATRGLLPDACVKVIGSMNGSVASVMKSGDVYVWTGFNFSATFEAPSSALPVLIPCPIRTDREGYDSTVSHDVISAHIDPNTTLPTLLVAYQNHPLFYRLRVQSPEKVEVAAFGEGLLGSLSVVVPFFATSNEAGPESTVVFAGDHLGCVGLYDWDAETPVDPVGSVPPTRKFEAYEDGSTVTALHWNGVTLVTGSARGVVSVWDGMTFRPLRSFPSPIPRLRGRTLMHVNPVERESVRHILVNADRDIVFMGIGDRVMAWQAGPVRKSTGGVRGRNTTGVVSKKKRSGNNKYLDQVEMKKTISESRDLLKDHSDHVQRAFGREREQIAGLNNLGLSEVEALEYVLMLSRDETNARAMAEANALAGAGSSSNNHTDPFIDEGVFEADFDDEDEDTGTRTPSSDTSRRPSIAPSISSSDSQSSAYASAHSGIASSPSSRSAGALSHSSFASASPSSRSSRMGLTMTRSGPGSGTGSLIPLVKPSPSQTGKVIVTQPYHHHHSPAEPMEAGPEYLAEEGPWMNMSASTSPTEGIVQGTRMAIEEHHFPPIASDNVSTTGSGNGPASPDKAEKKETKKAGKGKAKQTTTPPLGSPPSPAGIKASLSSSKPHTASLVPQRSISGGQSPTASSPVGRVSAWASPLSKQTSPPSSVNRVGTASPPSTRTRDEARSAWSTPAKRTSGGGMGSHVNDPFSDEMDDDLRFALELSLVEAQSRGDV